MKTSEKPAMRLILLMLTALLVTLNPGLARAQAALPEPNPNLTPREVVRLQLGALKSVDQPYKDAGFATVFRFTSPENRLQSGPLLRFSKMIREGFGEMINHKSIKLSQTLQQDGAAIQPVELISLSGRSHRYVFILRRQAEGEYRGCWMTDSVVPQDKHSGQSQEL